MSKTPIGFFKEPLSQVEVDFIYEQLQQEWIDQYWHSVFLALSNAVTDVCNKYNGSHISDEQLSLKISEPFNDWLRTRQTLRELDPNGVYSQEVVFSEDPCYPGYFSIEYSPSILLMRDGGYKYPSLHAIPKKSQSMLVNNINDHLVRNPELRIIPPHREALNTANDELVNLLRSRGYQSETNNNLPDFSEFLAKLIK